MHASQGAEEKAYSARVLNRVVRMLLNVDAEQEGGEESEGEATLAVEVEEFDGVEHLVRRYHEIYTNRPSR